jgi:hypothetical protein
MAAFSVPCLALGFISLPILNKIQSESILPPIIQEIYSKTMWDYKGMCHVLYKYEFPQFWYKVTKSCGLQEAYTRE